jgi:hypothetical protein
MHLLMLLMCLMFPQEKRESYIMVGTIKMDQHEAQVVFEFPHEDRNAYRVSLAISKRRDSPALRNERVEMWLLARGGKALKVRSRPSPDL